MDVFGLITGAGVGVGVDMILSAIYLASRTSCLAKQIS
jgi:hypothetical protein